MPYDNPLLYDDNTQAELDQTPGGKMLTMPEPSFFDNSIESVWDEGVANYAITVWNNVKEHVAKQYETPDLYRKEMHQSGADDQPEWGKKLDAAVYGWASKPTAFVHPDPYLTGTGAKILGEVAHVAVPILLNRYTGIGGSLLIGEYDRQELYQQLTEKGVDPITARQVSEEKGGESAMLFGLTSLPMPGIVNALASPVIRAVAKTGIGAGFMTGTDYLGGATRAQILDAHGYKQQAEQMRHWDWGRALGDIASGGLLGVLSGPGLSAEAKALLKDDHYIAAQQVRHDDEVLHEIAPGIPTDARASAASADASGRAANAIRDGVPVDVSDVPDLFDSHFLTYQRKNLEEAEEALRGHEGVVKHYDEQINTVKNDIEKARRDGMDDIAEHLEREELPKLQRVRDDAEQLAENWRQEIDQHHDTARAREEMRQHFEDRQHLDDGAESQRRFADEAPTPASRQAEAATARNFAKEAQKVIEEARKGNAADWQASAAGEALNAPRGKYVPPEMTTPEEAEILTRLTDLRTRAEAIGDDKSASALKDIIEQHGKDKNEAEAHMLAALCSIGL